VVKVRYDHMEGVRLRRTARLFRWRPDRTSLKSIRAARPDRAPIYVVLDNLSVHKGMQLRTWAVRNKVELCFTPTYASWASPIEAHFGPLRTFVIAAPTTPTTRS
jgi:hypothetical protein